MEVEKSEKYVCGLCRRKYDLKEDALSCEKQDKLRKQREDLKEFEVKDEHLKLLKEMYVGWNDCEFGAPEIDPKRPYGNSDGVDDVARVIGYKKTKDTVELEDCDWTQEAYDYLYNLHKDMQIVLQIVLSSLSFKKGTYQREDIYTSEWRFKDD